MNAKPTAIDTYLARVAAIHIKLARLQQLANDHFGHAPDAIHWGHVGDLGRVDQALDCWRRRGQKCRLRRGGAREAMPGNRANTGGNRRKKTNREQLVF